MTAAVKFRVNDYCNALIYPAGTYNIIDWGRPQGECPLGKQYRTFSYIPDYESRADLLTIADGLNDKKILRFTETKRYVVRLETKGSYTMALPVLQNENNKFLKCERDKNALTFQFINYLGRSKLTFHAETGIIELPFEVVPDKMNYEDDYIELTESLAEHCAELLLDYSGATSNVFTTSDSESETLLEQFIFLRQFCFSENIEGLFESIRRNPDRILVENEEFRPFGYGVPSKKVYTNPFSYTRNWNRIVESTGRVHYAPSEMAVTHKSDSLDTPANRFLKFALQKFDRICENLLLSLEESKADKQTECRLEALHIHEMLDNILQDNFFDDVGPMDMIPQNNQVLQKREGYSQILSAYNMIDLALQLDWKGKDNVYEGESKNIALLYEYWLFFELFHVVKSMKGCQIVRTDDNPFMSSDAGKLIISLKEGNKSCQSFAIPSLHVKTNLYYNRTFSPREFHSTRYEGSYSRSFRPDYTLAVFPERYGKGEKNGEREAILAGAVSYIHFDAKYRITNLKSLIGNEYPEETEKKELDNEKADEVTNTYKRGDLLKMHTYNDAIRRTVGSYVLYPGDSSNGDKTFHLYDEILPGVGAFALRPGIRKEGEMQLTDFIMRLISQKEESSSRLSRMDYFSDMVIQEPASPYALAATKSADTYSNDLCVIGYIRGGKNGYYEDLKAAGLLQVGKKFIFYYHAIRNGIVYTHHHDIGKAGLFRFFTDSIRNQFIHLSPVACQIISGSLVSKADLVKQLNDQQCPTSERKHKADFYYTLELKVISISEPDITIRQTRLNNLNGNDSFAPGSPRVVHVSDFDTISVKADDYK